MAIEDVSSLNDYTLRFLGYRSIETELYDEAMKYFSSLKTQELADYLAVAVASLELGKRSQAESILDSATRSNWTRPRKYELEILYRLLREIQQNGGVELFDEAYIDGLSRQFDGEFVEPGIPNLNSFCPAF